MPIKFCKVSGCRYPHKHTTKGHQCGICKGFGHGAMECGNIDKIHELLIYMGDELPSNMWCTKTDCCVFYKYHTTDSHVCRLCNGFHAVYECPTSNNTNNEETFNKSVKCPVCRKINVFDKKPQNVFGISDKCSVCMTNNVNMIFDKCRHACCCMDCFNNMIKFDENLENNQNNYEPDTPNNSVSSSILHPLNDTLFNNDLSDIEQINSDEDELSSLDNNDVQNNEHELFSIENDAVPLIAQENTQLSTQDTGPLIAQESSNNIPREAYPQAVDNTNNQLYLSAIEEAALKMGTRDGKIYVIIYAGMGCSWYFKRNSKNDVIQNFFMHSDCWGQYGENSDDREKLKSFLDGYTLYEYRLF